MEPGDKYLADKGFDVHDLIVLKGATLSPVFPSLFIFPGIFEKGQVADIKWVTDCSDKFRCWLFFSKLCQTLSL